MSAKDKKEEVVRRLAIGARHSVMTALGVEESGGDYVSDGEQLVLACEALCVAAAMAIVSAHDAGLIRDVDGLIEAVARDVRCNLGASGATRADH